MAATTRHRYQALNEQVREEEMNQAMQVLTSSECNEWYTPERITDAARAFMRGIDLDPASCRAANKWIRASVIFTERDNGLSLPWHGRVWLNPPYGKTRNRSNQDIWAEKLTREYRAGRVSEALMLTKCVPGYAWWEGLFRTWPVCFVEHRIFFHKLNNKGEVVKTGQAKAGASLWHIGAREQEFKDFFAPWGRVILPED